jgi:DNA-binding IclR family transcriptional regulator
MSHIAPEDRDDLLRALALFRSRPSLTVSEAADALSIPTANAQRLLSSLRFHGFVVAQEDSGAFGVGPLLVELALAIGKRLSYREELRPVLTRVSTQTGETVHLMSLSGSKVLFLDSVEGSRLVRVAGRTGQMLDAHLTASGKALLARLDQNDINVLYGDAELPSHTPNSIISRAALVQELKDVRTNGYAVNMGESEADVAAIAMATPSMLEWPALAISVSLPKARLDAPTQAVIIGILADTIASIGQLQRS